MPRISPIQAMATWSRHSFSLKSTSSKPHNTCEIYRKTEWGKYCNNYHRLLSHRSPNEEAHPLLTPYFHTKIGQEYTSTLTDNQFHLEQYVYLSRVTTPRMIWLPCMDERIQYLTASHQALSLGMPGCECLMSNTQKHHIAKTIISICQHNPSIEEIVVSSHSGCGAVSRAIQKHKKQTPISTRLIRKFQSSEHILDHAGLQYAQNFAHLLEELIQQYSLPVTVRTHHFQQKELHSQHLHNAFGAIINFDALLNTAELEDRIGLPMFNIYAEGQSIKHILDNIQLAVNIASSSDGFSQEYLNQDNPFVLLFTSTLSQADTEMIQNIIQHLQKQNFELDIVYKTLSTIE